MAVAAQPPAGAAGAPAAPPRALGRAAGVELLGPLDGSGYNDGASLVRRGDGTVLKLGALQYGLLACLDGKRDLDALAAALGEELGRSVGREHVEAIARKLAAQALLAGTEDAAPPRPNPMLALRWKVVVSDPAVTARLVRPFTWLFRPWLLWPVVLAFAVTAGYLVAVEGVAAATTDAFEDPELILLVFALGVASAAFHELGHAAASEYGGARPGAMGAGIYVVWPAFYTDVTGSYALPRRDRLRVDLGGLHFNAIVAVVTMAAWLALGIDALLLLIGLQLLLMVRQLPPVIRADGYHVLADLTGVPDLYAHLGPTLRRLVPGREHEPSALTGRARLIVTAWVLVTVPLLLMLALGALLMLPRLLATAWESGERFLTVLPDQLGDGDLSGALLSLLRIVGVVLPVLGGVLLAQRLARATGGGAWRWSAGNAARRAGVLVTGAGLAALAAWALWPAGQYEPVRARSGGTLFDFGALVASPRAAVRPTAAAPVAPPELTPGRHLAISMVPEGGASTKRPALLVIPGEEGRRPVAIVTDRGARPSASAPAGGAPQAAAEPPAAAGAGTTGTAAAPAAAPPTTRSAAPAPAPTLRPAGAFTFELPDAPGPGDTQALAVGKEDGGVVYDISYAVVTVGDGAPVANENSAFALASCRGCTTVAVSFQVVLVIGQSDRITPINVAGALNVDCPACNTIAIAQQLVLNLAEPPSDELLARLDARLRELDTLPELGAGADGQELLDRIEQVRRELQEELDAVREAPADDDGPADDPPPAPTTSAPPSTPTTPATTTSTAPAEPPAEATPAPAPAPDPAPEDTPVPPGASPATGTTPTSTTTGTTTTPAPTGTTTP